MAGHWRNLLEALLADPQQRLSELPLLEATEQQNLLDSLGVEPGEHRLDQCIHHLFSEQALARKDAPALTFAGQTLSYAELDSRANRLAWMLRERGVGPQVRVGLALERSLEMVVGLLAILKAGGAYVPLDPEYPLDRLHYMIEDSGIGLLLSDAAMFDALGELPATVGRWCLEEDAAALANYPATELPFISLPQHQAYLIYTSGSTGKPKGVVVSHGEIAMHCRAVIERFGMRPDDCELHFYSINFDAATERLLVPLLSGAQVVLRAQGQWDAEEICGLIRRHNINILGFTPSYGSQLAQWLATQGETLPVRMCITGGEALTGEHLAADSRGVQAEPVFQRLRPDRNRGHAAGQPGARAIGRRPGQRADRQRDRRSRGVHPRRRSGAGAARRDRRVVRRRRRSGAGLSPASGHDGRAFCRRSVRRRWRASVPHRRPGASARRWSGGIPRAYRPSSEDSWFPHRTGRNRNPSAGT